MCVVDNSFDPKQHGVSGQPFFPICQGEPVREKDCIALSETDTYSSP